MLSPDRIWVQGGCSVCEVWVGEQTAGRLRVACCMLPLLLLCRSILHPRESNESFIGDSLKFIAVMLVSG